MKRNHSRNALRNLLALAEKNNLMTIDSEIPSLAYIVDCADKKHIGIANGRGYIILRREQIERTMQEALEVLDAHADGTTYVPCGMYERDLP